MLTDLPDVQSALDQSNSSVIASNPYTHHSLLFAFTFLWGGNFVLAEVALRELAPISFSVSRFLVAGFVLVGIYYSQGIVYARKHNQSFKLLAQIQREDWPRVVFIAILGATLAPWLGIEGLNLTSGGRASLWLALCPVLSAGIGYVLRTESISRPGVIGLFIAGLGTVGLAADGLDHDQNTVLGDVYLILAICCIAAELHLMKPLVKKYNATSMVTSRTVIGGLIYLLVASPALMNEQWGGLNVWTWIAILIGGAVGVGVGQWAKVRALNVLGPTRVVLYGNLVPPATLLIAWIALGSNPTLLEVAAGGCILLGAVLLQVGEP